MDASPGGLELGGMSPSPVLGSWEGEHSGHRCQSEETQLFAGFV